MKLQAYRKMEKARFYHRLCFILITGAILCLPQSSSMSENVDHNVVKRNWNADLDILTLIDQYHSMKMRFLNSSRNTALHHWANVRGNEHAVTLSDNQFTDGKAIVDLPFGFSFYGHEIKQVAVTKEGEIKPASSNHWTIAPLMAKYGSTQCTITYLNKDDSFIVQWNNFQFNDTTFSQKFRFQVQLRRNGVIEFVYMRIPYSMIELQADCDNCLRENSFGVKYMHKEVLDVDNISEDYQLGFFLNLEQYTIQEATVIFFWPMDQCMTKKDCNECTNSKFDVYYGHPTGCSWCPAIRKCSSGRDIFVSKWKQNQCEKYYFSAPFHCVNHDCVNNDEQKETRYCTTFAILIIVIITFVALIVAVAGLVWLYFWVKSDNQPEPNNYQASQSPNDNQEEDRSSDDGCGVPRQFFVSFNAKTGQSVINEGTYV